jgi:ribosomal protein S18 acetylase RimI-like enzyme
MDGQSMKDKINNTDIEQIVQLIFTCNNIKESSSNYCYKDIDQIYKDVIETIERDEMIIYKDHQIISGVILWYYNKLQNTCDCSIFVNPISRDSLKIMTELIVNLKKHYQFPVKINFFFPVENIQYTELLTSLNAHKNVNEYRLKLAKGSEKNLKLDKTITILDESSNLDFIELFNSVFPDIYINGENVITSIGKDRVVYSLTINKELIAFSVLKFESEKLGSAEIIGVKESFRNKGYGRLILSHLIFEAFSKYNLASLNLVVDGDNLNAIKLYADLGFTMFSENYCYEL